MMIKNIPKIYAHICTSATEIGNIGEIVEWAWIWKINQIYSIDEIYIIIRCVIEWVCSDREKNRERECAWGVAYWFDKC